MPVERILITRHGYRSNWDTHVEPKPSPTGIDGDPPLSDHGVEQARELCEFLAQYEPKIDQIFVSPFYRCIETVNNLAERLDLRIYGENGFGEWYGRTRKTHPSPAPVTVLKSVFPRVDTEYEPICVPSTDGETIRELHDRAATALAQLISTINQTKTDVKTLLICSHAATIIALGRALVGDDTVEIRTGTCSISVYESAAGDDNNDNNNNNNTATTTTTTTTTNYYNNKGLGKWKFVANGYTAHLTNGEERHWSFEQGQYDFLDLQAYAVKNDGTAKQNNIQVLQSLESTETPGQGSS
ncbi:phosphoglycerate mutase-like protein [Lipomyces japonicus]|uniref:phosphoglycerate mutase-like protein n=1 Tax=Lipomyces japonicus TaxID=56871 RepID=UPI0034CFFE3F